MKLSHGGAVVRQTAKSAKTFVASECPLAGEHILQGIEKLGGDGLPAERVSHLPIVLFARAYGLSV